VRKKRMSPQQGEVARNIINWLGWADNDYLAARSLLLDHFIIQGAILSNTAVEKYLKTILLIEGKEFPREHDVPKLYEKLISGEKNLGINKEYLNLLFKCYKMRYPDDLENGFNIALIETKMLVELDFTIHKIRGGFRFQSDGKPIKTRIDFLLESNDENLMRNNCYFGSSDRKKLFEEDTHCYEMRVLGPSQNLEATYQTTGVDDDGKFDLIGLKPNN